MGSHIDRELNSSHYIQPFKVSSDGMVQMNLSQVPMKYQSFPLNLQLKLEIKTPYALDIFNTEQD